jgi:hypothetical protein
VTLRSPTTLAYPCALALALAMVSLLSWLANPIPANWDALYYIDMAKSGLRDNPHLVAPFAYRPAMPLSARVVASTLSLPLASGFAIVGWISAVVFLLAVFGLARTFTRRWWHALLPMVLLGSYFTHVKLPLHFYAFVDVAAYPLMVLAFWALVRHRLGVCVAISCVGLLFKEFLAIPLVLAVVQLGVRARRKRSIHDVARSIVAACVGVLVIVLPRVLIPVSGTAQFVDPINDLSTLGQLVDAPLDELRNFNIVYALVGCWLPTLVLITRRRFDQLWADLDRADALWPALGTIALVLLLTMYGGTNLAVFVGYMAGVQALVLALLLRRGVGRLEAAWAVVATVAYNKLLLSIPSPALDFEAYIDFYGGWSSRVTMSSLIRLVECAAFVAVGAGLRGVLARLAARRSAARAVAPPEPPPR